MTVSADGSALLPDAFHARDLRTLLRTRTAAALMLAAAIATASPWTSAAAPGKDSQPANRSIKPGSLKKMPLVHSGRSRVGMASYYANRFSGRRMADGTPMRPESNNAASRTLPLGTTAQVMNLSDGKTAVVVIRDRGPYARGRIIDLSPRTARQLGIVKLGVARVAVTPLTVPQPDGSFKWVVARSEVEPVDAPR